MKTVLLAWELGEGLGHIGGLRLIAKELSAQGWQPILALRDVSGTSAVLKDDGFRVLQAPVLANPIPPEGRPFGPSGYADILAIYGFNDADILGPMVAAWQNLIDLVKPDLIVADHSPTLCLAAHGSVPVVVVGYGFTVPPCDLPEFPVLRPEVPPMASQSQLLEIVNQVQDHGGRPALEQLPDLLDVSMQAVCTYPALDPYRQLRREPAIGPLEPVPAFVEPPGKPHLFAYLAADYQAIDELAVALGELKIPVSVYIRGRQGAVQIFLRKRGATVYDTPPPLGEVLPTSSIVLSHGGIGLVHAALAAGRPHIVVPRHLEASMTTKALQSLGIGARLDVPSGGAWQVRTAFDDILSQDSLAERAAQIASNMNFHRSEDILAKIADHCNAAIAVPRPAINASDTNIRVDIDAANPPNTDVREIANGGTIEIPCASGRAKLSEALSVACRAVESTPLDGAKTEIPDRLGDLIESGQDIVREAYRQQGWSQNQAAFVAWAAMIDVPTSSVYVSLNKSACTTIRAMLFERASGIERSADWSANNIHKISLCLGMGLAGFQTVPAAKTDGNSFAFTFVRHPIRRIASAYASKIANMHPENIEHQRKMLSMLGRDPLNPLPLTFSDFVEALAATENDAMDWHWCPQSYLLAPVIDDLDFIGRLESFDESLYELNNRFVGDPTRFFSERLAKLHVSESDQVLQAAGQELIQTIAERYRSDFEQFGYESDWL